MMRTMMVLLSVVMCCVTAGAESWMIPGALSLTPKDAYLTGMDDAPYVCIQYATDVDNRVVGAPTALTAENVFWPVLPDGSRNFAANGGVIVRPINAAVNVKVFQLVNGRISADTTEVIPVDPSATSPMRYLAIRTPVFAVRITGADATDDSVIVEFYARD